MGNINVQQHKFVVKAGMTIEDVKNSKEATALQKKYASAFDTDGQKGFSQKEADLFNSTTFSEKADGSVTFWTRQKDGTKKGTKFNSKDNIQFKSDNEVKPYVKKAAVKKASPKKEESVSFFDEAWSGHQIAKLTGDNVVTDWLQNKDKKCTDGKDDGNIGFWEGTKNFAKGLIGGIPKAIINHPLSTAVTVCLGAGAVALTGGAILPVLGAIGVATGVGMAGYGGYKAVTAKTDGEAKQALETMGMGVITTALSAASADKALEKAAEAGVKSAQVSEDAGIIDKTVQMFKITPEALKTSYINLTKPKFIPIATPNKEINFNNLDKTKTYVGLKYGNNFSARQVQYFSEEYCKGSEPPVHAFCMTYEDNKWCVYQSCFKQDELLGTPSGTHKTDALRWFNSLNDRIELFDLEVDVTNLQKNIGQPYGTRDIVNLVKASILNTNGSQSDGHGLICSEYIALGHHEICDFYKIPAWCITPAHFKDYFMINSLKPTMVCF